MGVLKGRQTEIIWPRMIANKLFRRKSGGDKFNGDAETEDQEIESEIACSFAPQNTDGTKFSSEMPVCGQSERLWTQSIGHSEYRIFIGTWNVAGRSPPPDLELEEWLNAAKEPSDIYVLGFQEIVPLKAGTVFGSEDHGAATKWDALIRKTLNKPPRAERGLIVRSSSEPPWNASSEDDSQSESERTPQIDRAVTSLRSLSLPNVGTELAERNISKCSDRERYKRVASKQMVGILITVWAKSSLRRHLRDLSVSCVGCGIMGCLGNKGSVSVSLRLHETTFCFVCTHLASGEKKGDEVRRNSDVAEILKRTYFPRFPQTIRQHDRIIWFGDLNYRLALPEEAMPLVHKRDWKSLQETDQLKMEQIAGRIFDGWREGNIDFPPTYKYAANSDEYFATQINKAGGKRRVPAWCDRILWLGKGLNELSYGRTECRFSDHRAVYALFSTRVDIFNLLKLEKAVGLSMKLAEAEEFLSRQIQQLPTPHPQMRCGEVMDDAYRNEGYLVTEVDRDHVMSVCAKELLDLLSVYDGCLNVQQSTRKATMVT